MQPSSSWADSAIQAPTAPSDLEEAGLTEGFLHELILKTLNQGGTWGALDIARELCLPFPVIEGALVFLKDDKLTEVKKGGAVPPFTYEYALTDLGRRRALDALRACSYVGPAPVPLEDYIEQSYRQAVTGIDCTPASLRSAFSHLILPEDIHEAVGAAIISGRSMFIFGPPGNGKTSIARAIGDFMNSAGGTIWVPYALLAENGIVTVYDPAVHQRVEPPGQAQPPNEEAPLELLGGVGTADRRWVRTRRPVIITGGELNLSMLDLRYINDANFYQAPMHLKANGGVFLIDDFGRQLVSPKELLNRWILPLEERHDYLTLASGKKFQVPFEELIIFSTNLDPKDLVDDAFLRRIRSKIEIQAPARADYERIFQATVKRLNMKPCPEAIDYLYKRYYERGRSPRASDCRDLLELVQAICKYRQQPLQLTEELMVKASARFIAEF